MEHIEWIERPYLRDPDALIAFEGWNDAADAASGAVSYLIDQYGVEPFAKLEMEEFMNFQVSRPLVELDESGTRAIHWPATGFFAINLTNSDRDLVVVLGEEPHLRWKTYTRTLLGVLRDLGVRRVTSLGAFIGQVAHTLPVPIFGSSSDRALMERHALFSSNYEGPTGIVGVLNDAASHSGFQAASLWAAIPHYLAANPNPKAMLALLQQAGSLMVQDFDLADLVAETVDFEDRVEVAMAESDEFGDYVRQLEEDTETSDFRPGDGEQLVEEIERYLRDSE